MRLAVSSSADLGGSFYWLRASLVVRHGGVSSSSWLGVYSGLVSGSFSLGGGRGVCPLSLPVSPFVVSPMHSRVWGGSVLLASLAQNTPWASNVEYARRRRARSLFANFALDAPAGISSSGHGPIHPDSLAPLATSLIWRDASFCFLPPHLARPQAVPTVSSFLDRGFFFPYAPTPFGFQWKAHLYAYPEAQPWLAGSASAGLSSPRGGEHRGSFAASRAFSQMGVYPRPTAGAEPSAVFASASHSAPLLRPSATAEPLGGPLSRAMPRAFALRRRLRLPTFKSRGGSSRTSRCYFLISTPARAGRFTTTRKAGYRLLTNRLRPVARPSRAGISPLNGSLREVSHQRSFTSKRDFILSATSWGVPLGGSSTVPFSRVTGASPQTVFTRRLLGQHTNTLGGDNLFNDPSQFAAWSVLRDPTGLIKEFVVPQVRYRPGAQSYWRFYRASLRAQLGLRIERQWRLSRIVSKMAGLRCYSFVRYLTSSLSWCVGSLIGRASSEAVTQVSAGLWSVNGRRCVNPFFQLYLGDILSADNLNPRARSSLVASAVAARDSLSVPGNFSVTRHAGFPVEGGDAPAGLEVDELAGVAVVVVDPVIADDVLTHHTPGFSTSVRMYNWKYTV